MTARVQRSGTERDYGHLRIPRRRRATKILLMKLGLVVILSLVHVMNGCHVWGTADGRPLGASRTIVVKPGAHVQIRITCPMDFDVVQTTGPHVALGDPRWRTGTAHTLVFSKRGVYRFTATNVQTPEQRGLETLGPTNIPKLTVRVR
jgi:hypothetical protein